MAAIERDNTHDAVWCWFTAVEQELSDALLSSTSSTGTELEHESSLTGDPCLKVQANRSHHILLPHIPTCLDVMVGKGGSISNKANKAPLPSTCTNIVGVRTALFSSLRRHCVLPFLSFATGTL